MAAVSVKRSIADMCGLRVILVIRVTLLTSDNTRYNSSLLRRKKNRGKPSESFLIFISFVSQSCTTWTALLRLITHSRLSNSTWYTARLIKTIKVAQHDFLVVLRRKLVCCTRLSTARLSAPVFERRITIGWAELTTPKWPCSLGSCARSSEKSRIFLMN